MTDLPPQKPLLVLDGGLGTSLQDLHAVTFSSTTTPLWSSHQLISDPATLLELQSSFAKAGADVILTGTYQASLKGFARTPRIHDKKQEGEVEGDSGEGYGADEAKGYMRSAVKIARDAHRAARNEYGLVALSLGAYGATMVPGAEYSGDYDEAHLLRAGLVDFHKERIAVFEEDDKTWAEVDVVAFETLPRVEEVWAVREVMRDVVEGKGEEEHKPFWIACVFPGDEARLPDGTGVEELVEALLGQEDVEGKQQQTQTLPTPYAIGINCTKLHRLPALIAEFEAAVLKRNVAKPPILVLYPDGAASQVYNTTLQVWEDVPRPGHEDEDEEMLSSKEWDERVAELVEQAVKRNVWGGVIVGGCCKTTPKMVGGLREKLRERKLIPNVGR